MVEASNDRQNWTKAMFAKPTGQRKNFQLFVTSGPSAVKFSSFVWYLSQAHIFFQENKATKYGKHILSPFLGFMNFYWFIIKAGEVTNTTIVRMQWFLQFLNILTHLHTCTLYGCNDFFSSFLKLLISNHWAGAEKLWLEEKFCTWQNNGRLFEILCNLKDFTKRALAGYFPFDLLQWLLLTINNDISSD